MDNVLSTAIGYINIEGQCLVNCNRLHKYPMDNVLQTAIGYISTDGQCLVSLSRKNTPIRLAPLSTLCVSHSLLRFLIILFKQRLMSQSMNECGGKAPLFPPAGLQVCRERKRNRKSVKGAPGKTFTLEKHVRSRTAEQGFSFSVFFLLS